MLLKKCSSYKSYFAPFSFNCLCKNIKSIPFSMEKIVYSNLVEFQRKNNRISTAIKMPQKWSIFYYQSVNQVWKGLDYHLFSFTANTIFGATTIWQCQKLCRVMTGKMLSRWKCKPGCSTLNPGLKTKNQMLCLLFTRPALCSYCEMGSREKGVSKKLASQLRVRSNKRGVASGAMWMGRTDSWKDLGLPQVCCSMHTYCSENTHTLWNVQSSGYALFNCLFHHYVFFLLDTEFQQRHKLS